MIYLWRPVGFIVLSMFISACSAGHKPSMPIVENTYVQHMKDFTHIGVDAMHQERWLSAEHAFERALQMAKLANDPIKITSAWYNVSMVYKAEKHVDKAEMALQKTRNMAKTHGFSAYRSRANLQLALLHLGQGKPIEWKPTLAANLPADVYLMAAKLAYIQHHMGQAEQAYKQSIAASGNDRSGLLLQAKAGMGLSLLAREKGDVVHAKEQALKVLTLCKHVGAPRLSANASLLLASMTNDVSRQERLDYGQRALDIYRILHDKQGVEKAVVLLKKLGE